MKYLFFCILVMLLSCTKEKPRNTTISSDVDIFIYDKDGHNLLLKTTPNTINFDSIRISYLINSEVLNVGCTKQNKKFPVLLCCETNKNNEEQSRGTEQK